MPGVGLFGPSCAARGLTFILLFCASFVFWYILKLGNTYTTEYNILVNVDGQTLRIPSVVEGVGTNLLGYRNYTRKEIKLRLSDLKYHREQIEDEETGEMKMYYVLDAQSVQNAISVRFSDIKIVSLGDIPLLAASDSVGVASDADGANGGVTSRIGKLLRRENASSAGENPSSK